MKQSSTTTQRRPRGKLPTTLIPSLPADNISFTFSQVVGNATALSFSYTLLRPFGVLISAGVRRAPQFSLTGRELYNRDVTLEFRRWLVRAMFSLAVNVSDSLSVLRKLDVSMTGHVRLTGHLAFEVKKPNQSSTGASG